MDHNQPFVRSLLILAFLFTLLNAVKPLCIDDTLYYYNARQVAEHPFEPYGYRIFWNDRPEPAVQVLAPVMTSYWWASAIKLFGDRPLLWKLWLFPYALLLVFSLHALLRRFAPGFEILLTWMIVISPVFLPGFNLMLDVPVAGVILCAIAIFLRAVERNSLPLVAIAGLIAGIAIQTKYNGLIAPAVLMLYGIIFRKFRYSLVTSAISAFVFLLWEGFIVWRAGQSAFLAQSHTYGSVHLATKYVYLAWPLVTIIGAVAPALLLLALVALRARTRVIVTCAGLLLIGYLLLAFLPDRFQVLSRDPGTGYERLTVATLIFSAYGIAFIGTLCVLLWRLTRLNKGVARAVHHWSRFKSEWFLAGWLGIEIVAYFGLSPIPAVRRVLGLLVVTTLIVGRLASRTCRSPRRTALARKVACAGMLLGGLFYAVDFRDAEIEKTAAETSAQKISDLKSQTSDLGSEIKVGQHATAWYIGRWGFQFYAEHAGMKPVLPDESDFQAGDWLAISDGPYFPQPVAEHIGRYRLEPVTELVFEDSLPLGTMLGYYNSGIPIHHRAGPRRRVKIYRVAGKVAQP